jgi:hypothetical protein
MADEPVVPVFFLSGDGRVEAGGHRRRDFLLVERAHR